MSPANLQAVKRFYEFGPFRIDVGEKLLFRDAAPIPLTPKAFDTLLALVESPGHILEKDDLMRKVWADTIVEENNLTQNISALRKALGQSPEERPYIETIPRRGYRFVATVRERWEDVPELIVRERTKSTVIVEEEETETRTRLNTILLVALSALILLVVVTAVYYLRFRARSDENVPSPSFAGSGLRQRPSVAVLSLKNLTGRADAAWLSTALSEMLTSELAAGDQLRAIPGENIARLRLDLTLRDTDSLAPDTLGRIRANLGSDYVVLGSFTDLSGQAGGPIRLDLRLQDARAGDTLATFGETGTESGLFELVSRAGAHLRQALSVSGVAPSEIAAVRAELPSSPEVAKLYADGIAKIRTFDAAGARELLEKAVAMDPQFPLAHSALGSALSGLGDDAQARAEAKKAYDLSGNLSRQERLVIEGRYRGVANEWDRALDVYRTLFGLFPDNLDYGISLVTAQALVGKGPEVLSTLATLRQLPSPVGEDPRIDMAEADWAESVSDFKRELAAASRAAAHGQALGATLLVARAQLAEGTALWKLGQPEKALSALAGAGSTFTSKGDRGGAAEALVSTAEVLADRGSLKEAREKYEQALTIQRAIGDEGGVAASLNDLALLKWRQSDLDGAQKMYDQALSIFRVIGDERAVANALNNIANISYAKGQIAAARRMYEDSAAKFVSLGDQGGTAQELANLGLVLLTQGEIAAARAKYEQAIAISRGLGTKSELALALSGLGQVELDQDDLARARTSYEESRRIRQELGEKGTSAESSMDLASLAIEEGRAADAEAMLPAALDEVRREGESDEEAYGEWLMARALLDQGKVAEAHATVTRARPLAEKGQNAEIRLAVATVAAEAEGRAGDLQRIATARRNLVAVRSEAGKLGLVDRELDARLALGALDLRGEGSAAARANLETLVKEAQEKGFGLIARRAAGLLN